MHHYYDFIAFLTVPKQVFKAFEDCSNGKATFYTHAKFQVGLCQVSGFGTEIDPTKGLRMVHEAAADGSHRARTLIVRLHRAFGIPVPSSSTETLFSWLYESAYHGSRLAVQDLYNLYPERSSRFRELQKFPEGRWSQTLNALCEAFRKGEEASISPQDVFVGPDGDSILHWCVFLPPSIGVRVATLLINLGCSPATVTRAECPLGNTRGTDPYCLVMPSRTTPIDWAIIENNQEVLEVLLRADHNVLRDSIEPPAFTPVTCASRFHRYPCLRHILESGHDASMYDENGLAPLFHASRPDIFGRVLQFSEGSNTQPLLQPGSPQQPQPPAYPPVLQREIGILKLLQEHGASLKVSQQDHFNCLHLAVAAQDSRVLKHLLSSADTRDYINQEAKDEWSPLGYAISSGNEQAINLLLAHGARINQVSSVRGYNALHICTLYPRLNSSKIAMKLIDRSHKLVNSCSKSGYTALHFAAVAGSLPLMNALAGRGARLMAAANVVTPLGLAIAYWSELGVEEMCKIHKKNGIPLVAAFGLVIGFRHFIPSNAVRPSTMILAPGKYSTMKTVRELRDVAGIAGCYDPPLSGPAENILKTILQYPTSGSLLEHLKIWYYQITQQYSFEDIRRGHLRETLSHVLILLISILPTSLWFLVYGVDEAHNSIRWAIRNSDSRVTELLLEEYLTGNVSANIRRLIRHSQYRIPISSDQAYSYWNRSSSGVANSRAEDEKILSLLMEQQKQMFSHLKLKRTNGKLRPLWKLVYRLYLDIEQTEYLRFNDWILHKNPNIDILVAEFRSWFPPTRIPSYLLFFAILWAVLGQMIYHLSKFKRNANMPLSTTNCVWLVVLVLIVSTTLKLSGLG